MPKIPKNSFDVHNFAYGLQFMTCRNKNVLQMFNIIVKK